MTPARFPLARIALQGTFRHSWYALLVIAGPIGAAGILTSSQILIVAGMRPVTMP